MNIPWEDMFAAAQKARLNAHAPYSHFPVGAALFTDDGEVISGCNVENASYGLSVCAERNAVARMVCEGKRLMAVAIVVDTPTPTPPCGVCRQVLAEFASPTLDLKSRNLSGAEAQWTLGELLPHAFTKAFLEEPSSA